MLFTRRGRDYISSKDWCIEVLDEMITILNDGVDDIEDTVWLTLAILLISLMWFTASGILAAIWPLFIPLCMIFGFVHFIFKNKEQ